MIPPPQPHLLFFHADSFATPSRDFTATNPVQVSWQAHDDTDICVVRFFIELESRLLYLYHARHR
jgi:hypothetical protein